MSCSVIIAAAGQGKRMNAGMNKQFIRLKGKPLLVHTLEKFSNIAWIKEIIVVAQAKDIPAIKELVASYQLAVDKIVVGGDERQDSIANGLAHVTAEWVMVHDGARPFVTKSLLIKLFNAAKDKKAVVLGTAVKDTIKIVDAKGVITTTPDRKSLWAVQTPQAFHLSILKEAYRFAKEKGFLGTDDASLVEKIGYKVHVIEGDYRNIKITTPEDLVVADAILANWSE